MEAVGALPAVDCTPRRVGSGNSTRRRWGRRADLRPGGAARNGGQAGRTALCVRRCCPSSVTTRKPAPSREIRVTCPETTRPPYEATSSRPSRSSSRGEMPSRPSTPWAPAAGALRGSPLSITRTDRRTRARFKAPERPAVPPPTTTTSQVCSPSRIHSNSLMPSACDGATDAAKVHAVLARRAGSGRRGWLADRPTAPDHAEHLASPARGFVACGYVCASCVQMVPAPN